VAKKQRRSPGARAPAKRAAKGRRPAQGAPVSARSNGAAERRRPRPTPPAETPAPRASEQPDRATAEAPQPGPSFPVVGIGASAGGLEALEQFLRGVPRASGMAFVIVQHLDPQDRGALVDLLGRATDMPVVQVRDEQETEPDHVYVIPPARDMSILHGVLHVLPQRSPRGLNLPVDVFFRSLAADRQERAIGVVLSGMGSDGTLGLRAIKEKGGVAFVQALSSAKFDGMPRSAIDAGLADVVASAEELPARILAYHRHAPYTAPPEAPLEEKQQSALAKVFILLRTQTGNDFSLYKRSTVLRRIERRMGLHQIDRLLNYVRYLRENPKEIDLLFKELLIGVTSFFRDPESWDHLESSVIPGVLDSRAESGTIRAWVPGCSTGEEAYSLAMVLREAIERRKQTPGLNIEIFATDLDADAIDKARLGVYPASIAADVTPERLRRFFVQDERGFRVSKDIRELVVFAPQNLIMDPPFTKLDIVSCRNLLIYLSSEVQKKIIPLFHYALNPRGVLFLGSAETTGQHSALFRPVDGKTRIYERLDQAPVQAPVEFFSRYTVAAPANGGADAQPAPSARGSVPNLQTIADRVILQHFAPTSILTTDKGDILYISGRTGKYLEPAAGRANLNVFAMAREGLRHDLSAAFSAALTEDRPVTVRGLRVGTNGGSQHVDVTVQRMSQPRELRGTVMIVVSDVAPPPEPPEAREASHRARTHTRTAELASELQRAHEELQSTREEMQTSQEELKSMNEELQSTNEELQSTNEELTTSKEEMQSMNEELQTVNHELQAKVDELSRSNNDMKNLFNSTDLATLFLDGELLVRRFTTPTSKLIKLIPGDTGRPITDITTELEYPDLPDDARDVLRTLVFKEKQVSSRSGRWFNVRILPYRTLENVIDGVVITFTDVTGTKDLEAQLRQQASELRQMTDSLPALVWGARPDGVCDYLSRQWIDYTGVAEAEHLGHGWLEQVHPEDRDRVRETWRAAVRSGSPLDTELRLRDGGGRYRWFKSRAVPIRDQRGGVAKWYGTHTDVDDLKRTAVLAKGGATALDPGGG
jgi:two-component system CheB/CheR fusion protein